MKRILPFVLTFMMIIGLTACAGNLPAQTSQTTTASEAPASSSTTYTESSQTEAASPANSTESTLSPEASVNESSRTDDPSAEPSAVSPETSEKEATPETGKVMVVVFSATGTTKGVAEKIAAIENAELYEIQAAEPYSAADLDWNDSNSRSTREQNDKSVRPAIGSAMPDLTGCERIYIGFPIWWGEGPRIMDTFVEGCDFTGITMIPFCTSGGSGIGRSGQNLEENAKSGTWLEGRRFSGSVSQEELQDWISHLK